MGTFNFFEALFGSLFASLFDDLLGGGGGAGDLGGLDGLLGDLQDDVLGIPGLVLDGVDDLLFEDIARVISRINLVGNTTQNLIRTTGNNIVDDIGGIIEQSQVDLGQQAGSVFGTIGSVISGAVDLFSGNSNRVLDGIEDLLGSGTRDIFGTIDDLLGGIGSDIGDALDSLDDFARAVIGILDDVTDEGIRTNQGILNILTQGIIPGLEQANEQAEQTAAVITESMEAQIEQSQENARVLQEGIEASIEAITGESESALATTREALEATGQEQVAATAEGAERVGTAVEEGTGQIAEQIGNAGLDFEGATREQIQAAVRTAFDRVQTLTNCPEDARPLIDAMIDEVFGAFSILNVATNALLAVQLPQTFLSTTLEVLGNCTAQAAARLIRSSLPSIAELQDQLNRGLISEEEALEDLFSQGFGDGRASNLLNERFLTPDVGFIQTWFLRGFIDSDTAIRKLADLGTSPDDIERMLQMSFFIPPVADLITMAVREVFSPEVAQRFGQFEDFPQDFQQFAAQQGISEFWARNYWAAHWALPSATQGFEMFHRKVISRDDLENLLRALDVMPFWRDNLTEIAFRPLTRVDIRRMHDLGLMTLEEVQLRYEDLGFSPDDARLMTQFTESFNAGTETTDPQELERLNRTTVTRLFRRGVIERQEAKDLLIEQGIGERAAEIFLTSEEVEQDIEEREAQTSLIIQQAKSGLISFAQAQDRMAQLGLTASELRNALTALERERAQLTQIPTVGQLGQMFEANIIGDGEFQQALEARGFSSQWAERLIQLRRGS